MSSSQDSYNEGAKEAYFTVAKTMIMNGFSIADVALATKISAEEIKKIKEELEKES